MSVLIDGWDRKTGFSLQFEKVSAERLGFSCIDQKVVVLAISVDVVDIVL